MNPVAFRTIVAKSQLRSSFLEPSEPINIEEPMDFGTTQRLKVALEWQMSSREIASHFKNSNINDIISSKVDNFLRDQLFDSPKAFFRHKRSDTYFSGRFVSKAIRRTDQSAGGSEEGSSPEPTQRMPETKAEAKQKALQNLQSYLTKSYETYRSNFYATSDKPKPPNQNVSFQPPAQLPVSNQPSLNLTRKLFPSTFAKQAAKRREEKKEETSCQFIDYYTSASRFEARKEARDEARGNARVCRFFKITVSSTEPKEAKPSISTQCSGNSLFQIN